MLNSYMQQTQELLSDIKQELINPAFLTKFVNTARGQLAGESESIRIIGTVATVIGIRNYNFSAINIGVPATTGAQGVIHVRRVNYGVASGQKWVTPRSWPWFDQFYLNNPVPVNGFPRQWAQYGQGGAGLGSITGIGTGSMSSGSFYLDPPPDAVYTLYCDCVCYPIALAADTDVEALPYLFTDAVPYFAAYLAYLSVQQSERATNMFNLYSTFLGRARQAANPSVLRSQYEQSVDPRQATKLGLGKQAAAG